MPARLKISFAYEAAAVLAGALLLARIGPFGTSSELAIGARHAYWIGTVLFAWSQIALARSLFRRARWTAERPIARTIASALAGAVPTVFVVAWVETLLRGKGPFTPIALFLVYVNVATVCLALTAVVELVRARSAPVHPRAEKDPVVANVDLQRFLERLPRRIGREVYAVEAEDHYLRIHTRLGSDLILLSMACAMEELAALDGMRVHRSWWVARDAVAGWERNGDRLTLALKNGCKVPVSRTYTLVVRNAGWLSEAA